jgi:DNA-binding beta-propeller fold protein YncE
MKKRFLLTCLGFIYVFTALSQKRVMLPNGWQLSPAGKSFLLGDLPLNIAVSSSKKLLAVTNNGQSTQSLQVVDVATEKITDNIVIAKSWVGIKFSKDEKYLFAAGGNDNRILKYSVINKKLHLVDSFLLGEKWPNKISPAGIEVDDAKHLLYVVTKDNNSLYIFDIPTKRIMGIYQLNGEAYTCILSPDKNTLYISC